MSELETLLAQVDADRLMAHVRNITQFERIPGSDEERAAFDCIEKALVACGLSPQRQMLPAYVSIPVCAKLTVAGEDIPCTAHSMLPSAELNAELVEVPDAASILHCNVVGKILLIDGLAMAPTVRAAQEAGALGVVFVAGSRHYHKMIVSTVWGSPEPDDCTAFLGIPAVTVSYRDGERIRSLLRRSVEVHMATAVENKWMELPVITADIGRTDKGYLMLTGHVDSWYKGAMDNASGNAASLEIARILAAEQSFLRRGVRVVFWSGHSHGRYAGSTAFCDAFFQDIHDNAFLHVNADCLGGCGATLLSQGGCMAESWALGDFAIRTVTGEGFEGTRFSRSCDQSFWGTGTPSLFSSVSEQPKPETEDAASKAFGLMFGGSKSGGYGWWWHTEADTVDKIDPELLRRDTRIFLAAVYKACADPVIPLDIRAGFAEFAEQVRDYAATGNGLDFRPLLSRIQWVENLLASLDLSGDTEKANRLILKFEQKLVPLLYVKKSRFGHDAASRQAPLPLLEEVPAWAAETNAHRRHCLEVLLKRRLNELDFRVGELVELLEELHERT